MHRPTVRRAVAHRPLWLRALITLWGVWFTTALTEPAGMFACQMHSGMDVGHRAHAAQSNVPSTHANHAVASVDIAISASAAMDHAAMGHGSAPQVDRSPTPASVSASQLADVASDAPPRHEHNCCTCLGQCCTAPPATTPVRAPEFATEALNDAVRAEFAERTHLPLQRAHALPYANGPPLTA